MATTLLWSSFADANCDSFNLYRAIAGITVAFPNTIAIGDKLVFSASKSTQQIVTMSGTTCDTLVADILAQAKGITAVKRADNSAVFIRVTATQHPRFQLYPCTFATHTSQLPRVIVPRLEFTLITNQTRDTGVFDYTFLDADGSPADWYHMTSVKTSVESFPTLDMQALLAPEALCVVVGRVVDAQNRPIIGARVFAQTAPHGDVSDNSGIAGTRFEAHTDLYGRFAIPLLQSQVVLLKIKAIGYNQYVTVPVLPYVLFSDLVPLEHHEHHWGRDFE